MSKKYDKSNYRELFGNAKRTEIADVMPPKYFCETCTKHCQNWCDEFNRHVVPDFNRCFKHSNYPPTFEVLSFQEYVKGLLKLA